MSSPLPQDFENLDPRSHIIIKGARVHNLKGVDVAIPRNQLVVNHRPFRFRKIVTCL